MPKTGLTPKEWNLRLREYARGTFNFGRGQKPPTKSHWAKEVEKIDSCPKHQTTATVNVLGQPIVCRCSYHAPTVCSIVYRLQQSINTNLNYARVA
jgi:hypothetical protein